MTTITVDVNHYADQCPFKILDAVLADPGVLLEGEGVSPRHLEAASGARRLRFSSCGGAFRSGFP